MLHAVTATAGLSAIWILWTGAWRSPVDIAVALFVAALALASTIRTGGASALFSSLPVVLARSLVRGGAVIDGVRATMAAALGVRTRMRPALVRARVAGASRDRVALAFLISATPGLVVVDSDEEGLLVHTSDEDAPDAMSLAGLETSERRA